MCLSSLSAAYVSVFPYKPACVQLGCRSSILTHNIVLLWCKKGWCLAEGEAIMAPLWIMRQECDPYLKVNVSSCPCRSPSLHCSLLYYRWWPWQQLIANNIHLNKPFHLLKILPNLFPLKTVKKNLTVKGGEFIFLQLQLVPEPVKMSEANVTEFGKTLDTRCFRPYMIENEPTKDETLI